MFKKLVILLALPLIFFATADAQKRQPDEDSDVRPERVVERETKPAEAPKEEPRREEPKTESPRAETPRQTEAPPSDNSSPSRNNETRDESRRQRPSDSEDRPQNRRRSQDEGDERRPKPRVPREPIEIPVQPSPEGDAPPDPAENQPPPAPPNSNTPPTGRRPGDNNGRGRRGDKDRDDDKKRRRRNYGSYPSTSIYVPASTPAPPRPFSANDYFDADDVFFNVFNVLVETARSKFAPFFDDAPGADFQPLYYTYGREFFANEFRFVAADWAVYYEPDLDDVFINLSKFGQTKFERMVWYPVGDTVKKANKKFGYKGAAQRPVLVEKIPEIGAGKLYSCSVKDLPKGEYEMRLIARDGTTVRHFIRLK